MSVDAYLMWGSTTVQLANGTLSYLTGYDTGVPSMGSDGRVTVTDQLRLRLLSVVSTMISTVMSINQMLERAAERKEKPQLAKVYLVRCLDGVNVWRSEIVDGRVNISNEAMHTLGRKPEVELVIERLNYWESTTLTEIALDQGGGGVIGGKTVYPWNDDDHITPRYNWVGIGSSYVSGDQEAPVQVKLENTYNDGGSNGTGDVYLGMNWNNSPTSLPAVLEGESSTSGGSILPASPNFGLYSNGQYRECVVGTSEAYAMAWTLSAAALGYYGGGYYTALLRLLNSVQAGTWARIRVSYAYLVPLYETPAVLLPTGSVSSSLINLGRVQLPPYLVNAGTALGPLMFELRLWRPAGGYTQAVDHIQLMPMDAFRKVEPLSGDIDYGEALIDDCIEENTYIVQAGGTNAYKYHTAYGETLRVKPGVTQRLHVVTVGSNPQVRTSKVQVYYRARRQTL